MTLLSVITYTGVFVFALTGALKARKYEMDIFGGLVVAFATAYGGGTVRDLLIGNDSDTQKRVTISMVTAGIFASTADPYLRDISDVDLRCALLACSQQLLSFATPQR